MSNHFKIVIDDKNILQQVNYVIKEEKKTSLCFPWQDGRLMLQYTKFCRLNNVFFLKYVLNIKLGCSSFGDGLRFPCPLQLIAIMICAIYKNKISTGCFFSQQWCVYGCFFAVKYRTVNVNFKQLKCIISFLHYPYSW